MPAKYYETKIKSFAIHFVILFGDKGTEKSVIGQMIYSFFNFSAVFFVYLKKNSQFCNLISK